MPNDFLQGGDTNGLFLQTQLPMERLRIQSREYNKTMGIEVVTKRAYEVSIAKLLD